MPRARAGRPRSSGPAHQGAGSRRQAGKAGGIRAAATPAEAEAAARAILGRRVGGHPVERLLVERRIAVQRELYAAVLTDAASKGPLILAAAAGGIEVEELAARAPDALVRHPGRHPSRHHGRADRAAAGALGRESWGSPRSWPGWAWIADHDLELVEVNPLALGRRRARSSRSIASSCSTTRPPRAGRS